MMPSLLTALLQTNLINPTQEKAVVDHIQAFGVSTPEALFSLGLLSDSCLAENLSAIFSLPVIQLSNINYQSLCEELGLRELITKYNSIPINCSSSTLTLAVSDPTNLQAEDDFRFATGLQIELVVANYSELEGAIRKLYGRSISGQDSKRKEITQDELANLVEVSDDEIASIEDLSQDDSPVSRFINQILVDAVRKGASDIHFEPYEEHYRVRLRCDGILVEIQQPASHLSRRLSARLKILAKLDIAERRLPQDGRIKLRLNDELAIDMRVSTLPTLWGEKIVLRLLDSSAANLDIDKLGYSEDQKALYLNALKRPQGMILMTGPTGSGKTVSLYTGLRVLNTTERNISTAEDPVEINLCGINQVQVTPKIGFGFAEALRSFLRQDPDVVMVGEIRDLETAEIAIKASQTGHLVLSTLHTNSAAETVTRLAHMGIEPFNLASSLSLIIAQRLARRLCNHCKETDDSPEIFLRHSIPNSQTIYKANLQGCNECNQGYSGRVGIYEVMPFSDQLKSSLIDKPNALAIENLARREGMRTLQESGLDKLLEGTTSYQELQRVLYI
ncbi:MULTISPECIES: type IV-A pilus assembly ATPase PilB [unclassified Vibrio]|uniref:type IV-A pilus assembly ATPase PilB n=1 Tax=unclassified Vibrio TaxID=2614977 RepID=UPI000C83A4BA|nr:type IV-A pilus assembly ATPase PilB [Vibrio sp. 10N.261.54.E10]PMK10773.1 type IV-A pilus assembly ATPase PilB [Vibrio sp. 10N.261.54.E10]